MEHGVRLMKHYPPMVATSWFHRDDYRALDSLRETRPPIHPTVPIDWPDWCYLPSYTVANMWPGVVDSTVNIQETFQMEAIYAWRATKGVYRVDEDALSALWSTEWMGQLPVDILVRLPEWCVYVPVGIGDCVGFLAWVDFMGGPFDHPECSATHLSEWVETGLVSDLTSNPRRHFGPWLKFMEFVSDPPDGLRLHNLMLSGDVEDGLNCHGTDNFEFSPGVVDRVRRLCSVLIYICTCGDIQTDCADTEFGQRTKKTKRGVRSFVRTGPRVWDVGIRMGAALRKHRDDVEASTRSVNGRRGPRPHIRRAHWHSFWTGPLDGERKLVVKWVPPTMVAAKSPDDLIPTIHMVEDGAP